MKPGAKKLPLGMHMALLAAVAMQGLAGIGAGTTPAREVSRARHGSSGGARYPEQSSRQALRGMRRAQGGPGLVLVGGKYQVREV